MAAGVRLRHIPTGVAVKCTQHRTQLMNRETANKILMGRLLAIAQEQKAAQIAEIRGDAVKADWGQQIRNYVMHPYKMVKDVRSGWETSDVPGFLDGSHLDSVVNSVLQQRAEQDSTAAKS